MSFTLTAAVWLIRRVKLPAAQKLVLLRLADRAQDKPHDGLMAYECNPGTRSISADCGLSTGATVRALQQLQQRGIISVTNQGVGKRTTVYRVNMATLLALHSDGTQRSEPKPVALHSDGTQQSEPKPVALHSDGTQQSEPKPVALHSTDLALQSAALAFHSGGAKSIEPRTKNLTSAPPILVPNTVEARRASFDEYRAIASKAIKDSGSIDGSTDDGNITEYFKLRCAAENLQYDGGLADRAIASARALARVLAGKPRPAHMEQAATA